MAYADIELNVGSGGHKPAVDRISDRDFQRVKPAFGVEGSAVDVSSSNPLPCTISGVATASAQASALTVLQAIETAVEGTLAVNSELPTAAALADNTANPTAPAVGAFGMCWDGSTWDRVPGTAADGLLVNLGANNDISGTVTANLGTLNGAATAANQSTANTALSAIQTAVQLLDNAVSGNELQVDVVGSLPAGSNTIGVVDLGATDNAVLDTIASPVATISSTPLARVAIFDASDAQITSFGGGTEYTEDAAAAANPVGKATILVRADTPAGVATTDGDNVAQRGTNFGAAYVQVVDSSGNFIDSFGGAGGTSAADDADFTAGTTLGTPVMGVYESSPTSVTDGDLGTVGISSARELKVTDANLTDVVTNTADTVTNTAAAVTSLQTIDDWDESDRCKTNPIVGQAGVQGGSGTVSANTQRVVLATDVALPAGTNAIGTVTAVGGAAHGAAVSGNPVLAAFEARTSDGTAVDSGDAVRPQADAWGKLTVNVGAIPERTVRGLVNLTDTNASDLVAAAASTRTVVMGVMVTNAHATVSTKVSIRDGTTAKVTGFAKADGGGFVIASATPLFISTANTAVTAICGTTGSNIDVSMWGYQIPG